MMRKLLVLVGVLLVILNAWSLLTPRSGAGQTVEAISLAFGLGIIVLVLLAASEAKPAVVKAAPVAPPPPPPRAEAEIVAFLALLQEKGRIVDFLKEEISAATDDQVGAAARVVHAGCRKVLDEYFEIGPVRSEAEGAAVILPAGYDAPAYRLLGSVPDQPPYKGRLVHPGWAAKLVKLPRVTGVTDERPWPVLAPAEVEVA